MIKGETSFSDLRTSTHTVTLDKELEKKILTKYKLPTLEELFPFAITLLALFVPGLTNFLIFDSLAIDRDYLNLLLFSLAYSVPFYILSGSTNVSTSFNEQLVRSLVGLKDTPKITEQAANCLILYYSILFLMYLASLVQVVSFSIEGVYMVLGGFISLAIFINLLKFGYNNLLKLLKYLCNLAKLIWTKIKNIINK